MKSDFSPKSAYVHVPFCRRRCFYCDFPVSVIGDRTPTASFPPIGEYVEILREEINSTSNLGNSLETVFFGGGTPSLLPPNLLGEIIATLERKFDFAQGIEISIEIDPATFTLEQLRGYAVAGVNRFSLGVQGFQDNLLESCGRFHREKDIRESIDSLRKAGIVNYSIDLISGLPGQTLEDWEESLERAIGCEPAHLSCYDLVLEPVTVFGKKYRPGVKPLPDDDTTADMYRLAHAKLTAAGYEHYEISNYARDGYHCRHNRVYWRNRPYYGFGMGAASYTGNIRFTRPRTRREYYDWVRGGLVVDVPPTTDNDRLLETLMLGLRLAEGVNLDTINDIFGSKIKKTILEVLERHINRGWAIIEGNSGVRLTAPEGFLFSNVVLTDLFDRLQEEY